MRKFGLLLNYSINCVVGILTQRWRLLMRPIVGSPTKCSTLVKAMCVLHNFLCSQSDNYYVPRGYADVPHPNGVITDGFWRQEAVRPAHGLNLVSKSIAGGAVEVRERWREYLSGAGTVDWQRDYINRR